VPSDTQAPQRLLIIDDDQLTREVLSLLAAEAGFEVSAYESGESALEALAEANAAKPGAVLADMQMSGVSGDSLARLLRSACGPATVLLAMSGTAVPAERLQAFDGFLLKPFSIDDLRAALGARTADPPGEPAHRSEAGDPAAALNPDIFRALSESMPAKQLRALYDMSLDDANRRIRLMREAVAAGDADAYRRGAHSIKGGCGMVGALELARLAGRMEESGPEAIDNIGAFDEFLAASERLRRILDAQLR
jgi:CheY-like chemotaxis protein